ncbi:hypothetical protein DFS34DRAFT_608441 [Phlyctochytrium arcticum]|nr:hypothetical protein DFS34DRAFT_641244 [Phlyctochytrium arcticum]KAI9103371.1 hypothetical protein DFS34DRAFT_608441 [Phlyctochytrium arcticum]
MPKALEPTKRAAIVALHRAGFTKAQICAQERVSPSAIRNTLIKWRETGSYETRKKSGRPTKATTAARRVQCTYS